MNFSTGWSLLRQTFTEWSDDKAPQLGAALAFYTALSIAPLLVIALAVSAFFLGDEAAQGKIISELQTIVGPEGGKAIEDMVANANQPTTGSIAAALSIVTLLFGASGVFGQLQSALNDIWNVKPKPGRGLWGMLRDRFLSFAMVLGVAFLLLVSLVITAGLAAVGNAANILPDSMAWMGQALNFAVSLLVITVLFALMFKYLPDVKIGWRDVWLGAIVTALLFAAGKFAIGLYLGHSSMTSSYGVAGSFVVLLVWTYYSAQIFFFGAELTQVYANRHGARIVPSDDAVATSA
ncbi:MAG TPA: YihY/virulence factor BrkB family protein [Lacipirellulaceae bacterium]|nr:YihY/virulence factor BrkB family protein [Lacipirellulaceae bacterium]